MIKMINNNKGSALVLVVFVMLIVFFLGTALLEISTMDFFMAHNQVDGIKAYYIAEAGMNKAIASFFHDPNVLQQLPVTLKVVGDTTTLNIGESFGGGNFTNVSVKLISKTTEFMVIELKVTGTYNNGKREIVSQGKLSIGKSDQFMASDTAVICVELFSTSSGSIYVDGNAFSTGGIDCGWGSTIKGDAFGYGNVSVVQGTVDGDLYGTGNVTMGWNANVLGDVTSRGNITISGGNDIGGDVFGSGTVYLEWDADVEGSVKALNTLTLNGANNIGGDVFSTKSINIKNQCEVLGNVITREALTMNGQNVLMGDCFSKGNMGFKWNERIDGRLVCYGTFTDGGGSKYYSGIWGRNVVMENSQTTVSGPANPIKYVDNFNTSRKSPYIGTKISLASMPAFPNGLDTGVIPEPEIKKFPGIPEVSIADYQGPGTTIITSAQLTSGRLNLANLPPGLYYVDDSLANLEIYGTYSGAISLVSKGKITVYNSVLRTDPVKDALMILSFSTDNGAIYINEGKTVDALVFTPQGGISTAGRVVLNGGALGKRVSMGWSGKIYHVDSILSQFGLGNTGLQSFEVLSWQQTSGML